MYILQSALCIATLASSAVTAPRSLRKRQSTNDTILTDINVISQYWGQISPYRDNDERFFGVDDIGIPAGCQIEQAHSLQRHAQRFPTGSYDDGLNNEHFAAKVLNFTTANPGAEFTGPLAFLNSYKYQMGESYLTGLGAATEFSSGGMSRLHP